MRKIISIGLVGRPQFFDDVDDIGTIKPIAVVETASACIPDIAAYAKATLPASDRLDFVDNLAQTGLPA